VQGVPFRVNDVGGGFEPVCVPLKPKLTVPPAGRLAFQLAFVTVT
jgi:hypothetical protein